jgi:hypothetical protein
MRYDTIFIYLFIAAGFPSGGSGPYAVHKRQEQQCAYGETIQITEHTQQKEKQIKQ